MKKERLIELLKALGWKVDRWGHFTKTRHVRNRLTGEVALRLYRVKMQATSCRYEIKSEAGWVRIGGDYFKNCHEQSDGGFALGTIVFTPPKIV